MAGKRRTVDALHQRLIEFRDRRDWKQFHTAKDLAISVSIESAELLELFQWKSDAAACQASADAEFRRKAADEVADVLIYLVLLAGELGIDPLDAAFDKVEVNEGRFPRP